MLRLSPSCNNTTPDTVHQLCPMMDGSTSLATNTRFFFFAPGSIQSKKQRQPFEKGNPFGVALQIFHFMTIRTYHYDRNGRITGNIFHCYAIISSLAKVMGLQSSKKVCLYFVDANNM